MDVTITYCYVKCEMNFYIVVSFNNLFLLNYQAYFILEYISFKKHFKNQIFDVLYY